MVDEPAPVRLYLTVPADVAETALTAALESGDVACALFTGIDGSARARVAAAQERGVAALVPDEPALAQRLGADGVHLAPGGAVKRARKALGDDGIVGADCGNSRHAAMLAGEAGADYVAFSGREGRSELAADPEILRWWQVMMTVPCVAMGPIGLAEVAELARAGADFIALDRAVWTHPDGPAAAVSEADRRLAAVNAA